MSKSTSKTKRAPLNSIKISLAEYDSEVAHEWHPTLNGDLTPADVGKTSTRTVWWQCGKNKDHVWRTEVRNRTNRNKRGCPHCRAEANSLEIVRPDIVLEFHNTMNGNLTPRNLYKTSKESIWWQCLKDRKHIWKSSVYNRLYKNTRGCPHCYIRHRCLEAVRPDLAREWHPTMNGDLTPRDVVPGSRAMVWWQCSENKDHVWKKDVISRTGKKSKGCPHCSSLEALRPDLAREWHPTMNGDLTPRDVVRSSRAPVWWQCSKNKDHVWQTSAMSRVKNNSRCPYCTSIEALRPDLAVEFHPSLNGDLTPRNVYRTSHRKYWWQCSKNKNHVWQASAYRRTRKYARGCPHCYIQHRCLEVVRPDLAREWHPAMNGDLTPRDVVPGSRAMVWWQCSKNKDHIWNIPVANRTVARSKGCPHCHAVANSLAEASPEVASEWHPTLNGDLTPAGISKSSQQKIWWLCGKSKEHVWRASVSNRTRTKARGCPYCAGKRVASDNCLETLMPELAAEWHHERNGDLTPRDVIPGSARKAWWQCSKDPSHVWEARVISRKHGHGCPYCSGRYTTKERSLQIVNPAVAQEWHPTINGTLTPDKVSYGSQKLVWWQCSKNKDHVWQATVANKNKGTGCPHCSNHSSISRSSTAKMNRE